MHFLHSLRPSTSAKATGIIAPLQPLNLWYTLPVLLTKTTRRGSLAVVWVGSLAVVWALVEVMVLLRGLGNPHGRGRRGAWQSWFARQSMQSHLRQSQQLAEQPWQFMLWQSLQVKVVCWSRQR